MSDTAVLDPPETEAPDFTVTQDFISKTNNLRLVKKPIRKRQFGEGTDFERVPGEDVQFVDGKFSTNDPSLIEWLDEHPQNGVLFHKVGFGPDGAPSDDSAEVVQRVVTLAFSGDFQKIAEMLVAERNTFSRPVVIAACEAAMHQLDEMSAATPPPTE